MTAAVKNHSPYVRIGRHRSSRPRTLNLIDLENLVGGVVDSESVDRAWTEFRAVVDLRVGDQTVVAVSQKNASAAFFALPKGIRRVVGADRPDGADIALLESIDLEWTASNFGRVAIGSGDHIFAGPAGAMRASGLPVLQVIGAGRCSTELYRTCDEHRYLRDVRLDVQRRRNATVAERLAC